MLLEPNPLALGLIFIGSFLSMLRESLAKLILWLHRRLYKTTPPEKLYSLVCLYLMITGIIFTIIGLLGLIGIWPA